MLLVVFSPITLLSVDIGASVALSWIDDEKPTGATG